MAQSCWIDDSRFDIDVVVLGFGKIFGMLFTGKFREGKTPFFNSFFVSYKKQNEKCLSELVSY